MKYIYKTTMVDHEFGSTIIRLFTNKKKALQHADDLGFKSHHSKVLIRYYHPTQKMSLEVERTEVF